MGMAKIPTRTSWEKLTWHRKKKRKIKTISKDNKMVGSLIAQIKTNCFHRGFQNFNPLLNSKEIHENHKVQKIKIWGISR